MAGKGGAGGESGLGGRGGSPGLGGPPWDELYLKRQHKTKKYMFCYSGHRGDEGKPGRKGAPAALRGLPGMPAEAGKEGRTGQVRSSGNSASVCLSGNNVSLVVVVVLYMCEPHLLSW